MTQEELREKLIERTEKGTQLYIAEHSGINKSVLSRFKTGQIDLYPHLFEKLCNFFENET